MILSSPGAVAFEVFGLSVYWYGIIMAFAILVGAYVADWAYKKQGGGDLLMDLIPWLVVTGVAGARLYYCALNYSYYFAHPFEILNVRQGGLSIHGMFVTCIVFLVVYCKKKGINIFNLLAPLCLGVSLAQSIGRWGNFFNSEAFGRPFEGFLKLYIAPALRPEMYRGNEYFHPTFLYESVLDLLIFVVLFYVIRKNQSSARLVTSLYFLLYGIVRIIVESVRIDSAAYVFGLPVALVVSLLLVALGGVGILLDLKTKFR
ncbi:MAG: prolipoprotein diacylglyceryl transferase [Fusobacterium sp.]|nr:prolipoprotein diacylglyceryl transferase [Fusobacterium sp.]